MSDLSALMFALALVLWMQAGITNSSTSVTSSPAAPASVTSQAPQNVTSSSIASASVTAQASESVTSSAVASASLTVQAFENATSSLVASASVSSEASEIVTSSLVALASVTAQASKIFTSSPAPSASVTAQLSKNVKSSPVASASVTVQASKNVTSSPVASASVTVQASKSVTSSTSRSVMQASHNSTITVKGSASLRPTPGFSASAHFNKTAQPSMQVSPNASSSTSSPNMTISLSSAAVSATAFTSQSLSTFSVPGQTSKKSMLPSLAVTSPSPSVSQSTRLGTSTLAQSFSKEMVSIMTHLTGSLTVSTSNSSSTSSLPMNTTSAVSPATPTTAQPTAPTLPPGGTRIVSMEVSFDILFKEEYKDTSSTEYKEFKDNLTTSLEKVYKKVDGFVGVRILFITEGSVVCSYIVILAKDSKVKESELKETLQQASNAGDVFKVQSIKAEEQKEGDSEETEEKLPSWALVVMVVLGCLSAVFLITVIYVCVRYRRSLYGSSEAYLVSTGDIGLVHTYDSVSIGDNKTGANQGTAQKPAADRRVIGSHTNPAYGSNGALAD